MQHLVPDATALVVIIIAAAEPIWRTVMVFVSI